MNTRPSANLRIIKHSDDTTGSFIGQKVWMGNKLGAMSKGQCLNKLRAYHNTILANLNRMDQESRKVPIQVYVCGGCAMHVDRLIMDISFYIKKHILCYATAHNYQCTIYPNMAMIDLS